MFQSDDTDKDAKREGDDDIDADEDVGGKAMMQEKKRESCETEAKLNRNCKLDQTWDIFVTPQIFILQVYF